MGAKRSFFWEDLPPEKLWYFIGWITSDGSLSKDGRHINLTSKDLDLLEMLKEELHITNKIGFKTNGSTGSAHQLQLGSVSFYHYLQSIGLCPNKSLCLERIAVPDDLFLDFLRGMIDGDGSIRHWIHPTNGREQWSLRIYSGSQNFLLWISETAQRLFGISGGIYENGSKNVCYVLKYGKIAAQKVLSECYIPGKLSLDRKRNLAQLCIAAKKGWSKSKTVQQD